MTFITFSSESDLTRVEIPSLEQLTGSPQFNLRKRSNDHSKMNLSSYNSAFLSGLFADVARVTRADMEQPTEASEVPSVPVEDSRLDPSLPVKRSRPSLNKSFSRCGCSYKNFAEVSSPKGVDAFPSPASSAACKTFEPNCSSSMERMNSLHFQLNCVNPSASPKSVKSVIDIIDMAFPHLPATVSNSSCDKQQDLTQTSDQPVSDLETPSSNEPTKESYGWFVELDDGDEDDDIRHVASDPYSRTNSSLDLAFSAPTAPKRLSQIDAEVEWAKAADTVDDVLGDFF